MKYALWIAQILLALLFLGAGLTKATSPIAELAERMPWAVEAPWMARVSGWAEVLGALGLVLPSVTRVQPRLTPLAALCLAIVMGLAVVLHVSRGEMPQVMPPLVIGALCLFVAWGRSQKVVIAPRGSAGGSTPSAA
ncbi:MAG: DoxX family protein [Myxococcota bacterium]